ncbi:MAG: SUMF1/EgtB/PvdO family nonheme iron enzyme, partial [Planctomycetota bacterium]
ARFANWMHNGQQNDPNTAEYGAYDTNTFYVDFPGSEYHYDQTHHDPNALYFLPTWDEWYKAAFYKRGDPNAGYWEYPVQCDTRPPLVAGPWDSEYRINWEADNWWPMLDPPQEGDLVDVNFYTMAYSAYGTAQQGGNAAEWVEDWWPGLTNYSRAWLGGAWKLNLNIEVSRRGAHTTDPEYTSNWVGFRLAKSVEPSPPSPRKKLFQWGYGDPDTSHFPVLIGDMLEQPLDGTVFRAKPLGGTMGEFNWESWGSTIYTREQMQHAVDEMQATDFGRFTETFLRLNVTPGNVDWFDDYSAILANCGTAAWIVEQGGARGIMLDTEAYEGQLWDYNTRKYTAKSFEEYCTQVRLRGRQVIEAMQAENPYILVFVTVSYTYIWKMMERDGTTLLTCDHGLLPSFIDGLIEGAGPGVRLIDAYEWAYLNRTLAEFQEERQVFESDCLPIVRDPASYASKFELAFPVWLDYGNRWGDWHYDPNEFYLNYYTPKQFNQTLKAAMQVADEYVWIYNEWLFWWDAYGYRDIPLAYEQAVRDAWTWIGDCSTVIDRGDTLTGDLNRDCHVDFADLIIMLNEWLICNNPQDGNCITNW